MKFYLHTLLAVLLTLIAQGVYGQKAAYSNSSVLASGEWYSVLVSESGMHKITYDDLKALGMNVDNINPANLKVYGNGGELLPLVAGDRLYDDLVENAVEVVVSSPGRFSSGDYILFYGRGTLSWQYNTREKYLQHIKHPYADKAVYFVTHSSTPGKRIRELSAVSAEEFTELDTYTGLYLYEEDKFNEIRSGRIWYGENIYPGKSFQLPAANFPDRVTAEPVKLHFSAAASSSGSSTLEVKLNGRDVLRANYEAVGHINAFDYAMHMYSFASGVFSELNIQPTVTYVAPGASKAMLDFLSINAKQQLIYRGGQMPFRAIDALTSFRPVRYTVESKVAKPEVWMVSRTDSIQSIRLESQGNLHRFTAKAALNEFIAFDRNTLKSVERGGKVQNQNLHSLKDVDMVILTHPLLLAEADRLAQLHNSYNNFQTAVVTVQQVYNEFSSGVQDITAIRDFMKMFRERQPGKEIYLTLFGSASYDVKKRITPDNNLVPTYQTENSVSYVSSFLSDDYFGLLDDGEGGGFYPQGDIDINIGRIPARNEEQARVAVDKLSHYTRNAHEISGDWLSNLVIVADDGEENEFFKQAERWEAEYRKLYEPVHNIHKIYLDAYRRVSTPAGSRYPDAAADLLNRINNGALVVDYIGHGGEFGWADERILELADIESLTNYDRMGLFFTATCEFTRFDNPAHQSPGERLLMNPFGGAIGLITTTRLAFADLNRRLNESFLKFAFQKEEGQYPPLGRINRLTKNDNMVTSSQRNLSLIGDPAFRLPSAANKVVTKRITFAESGQPADTLSANSLLKLEGEIIGLNGQKMTGFNGEVTVKIFDKEEKVSTLGQDPRSRVAYFYVRKNVIYQGRATVRDGAFTLTFPLGQDVSTNYGAGRITYYATGNSTDASGFDENIIIGGYNTHSANDSKGPDIELYLNSEKFEDGDETNPNPLLIANIFDESGINTIGLGVGHEIFAVLDDDKYNPIVLNDYFISELDSYTKGSVQFRLRNIPDGTHTLTLKAWDVQNNSTEKTITFVVNSATELTLEEIVLWPNPSAGEVNFNLKHNVFDASVNITMRVFNTAGMLIRSVAFGDRRSIGNSIQQLRWDGTDDSGRLLRPGMYIVNFLVTDQGGHTASKSAKVFIKGR